MKNMEINTLKITAIPGKIFGNFCSVYHRSRKTGSFRLYCDISRVKNDIEKFPGGRLLLEGSVSMTEFSGEYMEIFIIEKAASAGNEEINIMEITAEINGKRNASGRHTYTGSHYRDDSTVFPVLFYSPDIDLEPERYALCRGYLTVKKNRLTDRPCFQMVVEGCDYMNYEMDPEVETGMKFLDMGGVCPYHTLNDALDDKYGKYDDLQKERISQLMSVVDAFRTGQRNKINND